MKYSLSIRQKDYMPNNLPQILAFLIILQPMRPITNETDLSYILADLLSPKGSHQQDDLFLKHFIKICLPSLQCHEWNEFLDNLANIDIEREEIAYANQSNRKMDIYLTDGVKYGICIENKPYAKDQQDQLSDYYKELIK